MGKKAKDKAALPKKVAGVKVPKSLRKNSDSLSSFIASPLAREIVADALIAIAGVLAGNKKTRQTVAKAGSAAVDAGADAASATRDMATTATGAVAEVVTDAARRILPASLTGEDGDKAKKGGDESRYAHLVDTSQKRKKKDRDKHQGH